MVAEAADNAGCRRVADVGGLDAENLRHLAKALCNLLLGHVGEADNLLEGTLDALVPARNEDARGNDGCLRLGLEQLFLLLPLEELLGAVGYDAWQRDAVALDLDLLERLDEQLLARARRYLGGGALEPARDAAVAVLERDDGRQLACAGEKGVARSSDSGRVVSLRVGECSPCATRGRSEDRPACPVQAHD